MTQPNIINSSESGWAMGRKHGICKGGGGSDAFVEKKGEQMKGGGMTQIVKRLKMIVCGGEPGKIMVGKSKRGRVGDIVRGKRVKKKEKKKGKACHGKGLVKAFVRRGTPLGHGNNLIHHHHFPWKGKEKGPAQRKKNLKKVHVVHWLWSQSRWGFKGKRGRPNEERGNGTVT